MTAPPRIAYTVDVETDWGGRCPPGAAGIRGITEGVPRILECFAENNIRATFFISGDILSLVQETIRRIMKNGHEIACHGHRHRRISPLTAEELAGEISKAKQMLESVCAVPVEGFRAPQFDMHPRLLEILGSLGFSYDSSIVVGRIPFRYRHKGLPLFARNAAVREFPLHALPILPVPPGLLWIDKCGIALYRRMLPRLAAGTHIVYLHPFDMLPARFSLRYGAGPALFYAWKRSDPGRLLGEIITANRDAGFRSVQLRDLL